MHFAFPHREMAFPTARERDYGNQKVSLLVAFLLDELDVHIRITDAGCASAGTMSTVASRTTLTISSMSRNVLLNLYPNFYPPLGRFRVPFRKWLIKNAEKRTRTSTPLRALEPESSASANSAISAKDFKSMFFDL